MNGDILDYDQVKSRGLKKIYKFKHFDGEGYYKSVLNNELYFSTYDQLNDPFDSQILTRYDLCTQEEKKQIVEGNINNFNPSNSSHIQLFNLGMEKLNAKPELIPEEFSRIQNKDVGIFSLTEKLDNFLLWSYYTDGHRGFCIEFDAMLLDNHLNACYESKCLVFLFCKINYQKKLPLIHPIQHGLDASTRLTFLTKSCDWKHEEEWRILLLGGNKIKLKIPQGIIKKIYFGVSCDEKKIEECKEIALTSNPEVKFFRAKKKKDKFGLDFLPI